VQEEKDVVSLFSHEADGEGEVEEGIIHLGGGREGGREGRTWVFSGVKIVKIERSEGTERGWEGGRGQVESSTKADGEDIK